MLMPIAAPPLRDAAPRPRYPRRHVGTPRAAARAAVAPRRAKRPEDRRCAARPSPPPSRSASPPPPSPTPPASSAPRRPAKARPGASTSPSPIPTRAGTTTPTPGRSARPKATSSPRGNSCTPTSRSSPSPARSPASRSPKASPASTSSPATPSMAGESPTRSTSRAEPASHPAHLEHRLDRAPGLLQRVVATGALHALGAHLHREALAERVGEAGAPPEPRRPVAARLVPAHGPHDPLVLVEDEHDLDLVAERAHLGASLLRRAPGDEGLVVAPLAEHGEPPLALLAHLRDGAVQPRRIGGAQPLRRPDADPPLGQDRVVLAVGRRRRAAEQRQRQRADREPRRVAHHGLPLSVPHPWRRRVARRAPLAKRGARSGQAATLERRGDRLPGVRQREHALDVLERERRDRD